MLNDAYLGRLEELCRAATPGPWYPRDSNRNPEDWTIATTGETMWPIGGCCWSILMCFNPQDDPGDYGVAVLFGESSKGEIRPKTQDLDFIAAARTAVPELLSLVRSLKARVTELETRDAG